MNRILQIYKNQALYYTQVVTTSNVKGQLKVLQQIQLEESKRRQEKEKAQIMKEAKSRSKQSNSEAKAKAKQVGDINNSEISRFYTLIV